MIDSGEGGWVHHSRYGTVYQPDTSGARAAAHAEYDAWYGEGYDQMKETLDLVQYAATRQALLDVLEVMDGHKIGPEQIRAMLDTLAHQQHGEQS